MGKALIVSGGAAGQYTIKLEVDRSRVDAEITEIEAALDASNERLAELEVDLLVAEVAVLDARDAVNAVINDAVAAGEILETAAIRVATAALLDAASDRDLLRIEIAIERARWTELQTRLRELGRVPLASAPANTIEAWCGDFTEDLSGEVGTVEVNGEGRTQVIVRPGSSEEASVAWTAARDGQLVYREGMSSAQAYFNAAILPGWQKFQPTHRVGVIAAIDSSMCSVTLDAAISSAYELPINQAAVLTQVPVEYMTCNAAAFTVGDRVVVEFTGQNWEQPKVIGFETNPKRCEWVVRRCEVSNSVAWRCFWRMSADELFWWVEGGQEIFDEVNADAVIIRVNGTRIPFYRLLAGGMDFRQFDGSSFFGPYIFFSSFAVSETKNEPGVYLQFDADAGSMPDDEYLLEAILDVPELQRSITRKVVLNRAGWTAGTAYVEAPIDNTLPLYWGGFGGGVLYSDPLPLLIDTETNEEYQNPNVALAGWAPAL